MIKIGVSSCLLGQNVRYDGGHKQLKLITKEWLDNFEYIPYCPEVAIGLPTPRKVIRLVQKGDDISLVESKNPSVDHTQAMTTHSLNYCESLDDISGYILTSNSPSCGMERVKLYQDASSKVGKKNGVGLFAANLMKKLPNLPIEEDGRLGDLRIRDNFLTRVYAYKDFQDLLKGKLTRGKIIKFHSKYKYLLMAHYVSGYKELGKLVAHVKDYDLEEFAEIYISKLMSSLSHKTTKRNHTNTLQHIQGYFRDEINSEEKQELSAVIMKYHGGILPIQAPLTLLKHYLKKYPNNYLEDQVYFSPYPEELIKIL
ncbi:MAG: DUF1722 domain-containing protein [Candidatus Cloacimonetes bacterium]|nr:DUF1722 domain-containing protein [Candidatus Cloacimonadota bacterium]